MYRIVLEIFEMNVLKIRGILT